ncbi:acyl-CoA dehydrogenase family protein [Labrys wisconsinensis]|uniref:Alkylation response protein AidB-like acyl-CoA dehydrogenase n=1 Tax=Labrys wisconsinensis TaxID=425677 RepID=A0ABU0JC03_9HYPH|nr:acyl-CoA dehydrogenase family protein [Labrys wisconsinensis]MDQ0471820.1 alkylation response protein AidB-like acyl-CoA dehydrogenase [Labrys wisconsinensis]
MSRLDDFTDEEREILSTVRRFVAREVRPHVARLEREGAYPEALVAAMAGLGLFGMAVPEAHGGLGLRLPVFARVMELIAAGWTTLAGYLNSHSTVCHLVAAHGTEEQKARLLPALAEGRERGALCLTEPAAGSDLRAIETRAVPCPEGYRLSGRKIFVTNGGRATLLAMLARTPAPAAEPKRDISLFLVAKNTDGISVAGTFHKMAYDLVDTVEILAEDAPVSPADLLGGRAGAGLGQLLDGLELGRIAIAASAVGLAASALAEARRYASERRAFGVTIDQHQAIQLRLADMATRLVAARLLTAEAARARDTGARADMLSGMAKLFASEACLAIVDDALRIHGGYGYIADYAIERLYREAPLYIVGEGTNDIQKLVIARRLSDPADAAIMDLPQ